jgi:hypothetical protein
MTTGCVALLALIAGTVSYPHMHLLLEMHGQSARVAALTPLSVDGMIVAASTAWTSLPGCGGMRQAASWVCKPRLANEH